MTYGRQPRINDEINWVTDEDGNVIGSMSQDGRTVLAFMSGSGVRMTANGIPDPRSMTAIQATLIEPGYTDKYILTANPQRVVAIATNATNTAANVSVYSSFKQVASNIQSATDPVLMRFADIRGQITPFQVTSGANAAGLFVEVL